MISVKAYLRGKTERFPVIQSAIFKEPLSTPTISFPKNHSTLWKRALKKL
jgi:hypothetical protein